MKLSVIITTYNSEEWLQKVLLGYSVQTETDFDVSGGFVSTNYNQSVDPIQWETHCEIVAVLCDCEKFFE